jgi:L-2,4-diaminobutyrate decarboxylase
MFEAAFLSRDAASRAAYRRAIEQAVTTLERALPHRPYSGKSPAELTELLAGELCPAHGQELGEVLWRAKDIVRHSVVVTHPHTAAHLHCPPLLAALAAEVLISAINQSMDSFDQAPAATVLEQSLVRQLCRQARLPDTAGGTFTAGGTQSNYTALWLARDAYLRKHHGWSAQEQGLPAEARRLRFLCSEAAHFTVEKSAAQLGLGTRAVVRVAVDGAFRLCVRDLRARLESLRGQGLCPVAVVATAGTTDFGSIDPLAEVADLAKAHGAWFHVDAAYGGALLFSGRYASRLGGVERADSLTLDFHKLFWQPISCGAFLVRDAAHFDLVKLHADYLNPEDHENQGIPDLVTRSVLTSRRFDALKLWVSLQVLGREQLAQMIDRTLDLAGQAADLIRAQPRLELLHRPELGCVVFRYRSEDEDMEDALNERIRRDLFDRGQAVVGHTRVSGRKSLKLTLLNPATTPDEVAGLLEQVVRHGERLEREFAARTAPGPLSACPAGEGVR